MKTASWVLIVSMFFWSIAADRWTPPAYASTVSTTGTETCTDNRTDQQGWKDSNCYTYNNTKKDDHQTDAQEKTEDTNDQGSNASTMMGMAAIAAGSAMVAAGMACSCPGPNAGLIAAGTALIMAGMMALQAAQQMAQNANTAGYNAANMGKISGLDGVKGANLKNGTGGSGIKIDSALLRNGKFGAIMDDFEDKTGMSRDELAEGLSSGRDIAEMLANMPGGKNGVSEAELKGMLDQAAAGDLMSSDQVMAQLGLTNEDIAGMMGDSVEINAGGGSRAPASSASNSFDGMFAKPAEVAPSVVGANPGLLGLSPDLQAALDKNGISNKTIFQMVSQQYRKKTPMLFGAQAAKKPSTADNPFAGFDENL